MLATLTIYMALRVRLASYMYIYTKLLQDSGHFTVGETRDLNRLSERLTGILIVDSYFSNNHQREFLFTWATVGVRVV